MNKGVYLLPSIYGTAFEPRHTKAIGRLETRVREKVPKFSIKWAYSGRLPDWVDVKSQRILVVFGSASHYIGNPPDRHILLLCLVRYTDAELKARSDALKGSPGSGFIYVVDTQARGRDYTKHAPKLFHDIVKFHSYREVVVLGGAQNGRDCFQQCLSYVALSLGGLRLEEHLPQVGESHFLKPTK